MLCLLACAPPSTSAPPAAGVAPGAGPGAAETCPAWPACTRITGPVDVSAKDTAYGPEVAWTGSELLVLYRAPASSDLNAPLVHVLATVGPEGGVRRRERIVGSRWAKIAWSPAAGAGLVVSDVGLTWLTREGRAMPAVAPVPDGLSAAMPVEASDGFVVLAALEGGAVIGRVGTTPGAVTWRVAGEPGRRAAILSARAASGGGTRMAASRAGGAVDVLRLAPDGAVASPLRASASSSLPPSAALLALAGQGESLLAVYAEPPAHDLTLMTLAPEASAPRRLDARALRSDVADLVRVGSTLVLGTDQIGAGAGVAAAALDAAGALGPPVQIGEPGSEGLRFTATPRGFAAVWTRPASGPARGASAMLAVYDCCPR